MCGSNKEGTSDICSVVTVYGGSNIRDQIAELKQGCDIIVGTPGRLIDLLNREEITLKDLRVVCLDEADEMLNQGFQLDIEKIFLKVKEHQPKKVQTLMFSATIPDWIHEMSEKYQDESKKKYIDLIGDSEEENRTSKTVEHCKIQCDDSNSSKEKIIRSLIEKHCINDKKFENPRILIFCETKRQVNEVGRLFDLGIKSGMLHGDIPQVSRERVFKAFKKGELKCIVATNVAARGLDFPEIPVVIQLEPPKFTESYIHRSGRTGRAGKEGMSVTLYTHDQRKTLWKIEKEAKIKFR